MKNWWTLAIVFVCGFYLIAAAPPTTREEIPEFIKGAKGLEEALRNLKAKMAKTPILPPEKALAGMKVPQGLSVDLLASEPVIKQPLYLSFDERGRIWLVQYRQYPFPAGLKVIAYDRYIRAKFDKVPPPPPHHFKGSDRISILEDVKRDGSYSSVKTFVDGLNVATAALVGRGGVWVLNPPYLLFYPDPERKDVASDPVVHLSGFGLEDTHSVASSLCWGPDGWLYGAHGSTVTAKVKVEVKKEGSTTDFLGQAIWRYHPETHQFEIFAEGGGNTFGVAFDDVGRVYSGTNWGSFRGVHYVQGGYYVKGWGKHGPLTNPYALGYFPHMPHVGNGDRLVHTFIVYGESALPQLQGKIVGVNPLQRRLQVTRLASHHSTLRTVEEPFLLTTEDERFRPVDVKAGPDGALYVADMYEPRINHVDPRDNWDKSTGRLYRIRPANYQPAKKMDFGVKTSAELVQTLRHESRWYRDVARRVLADRKDRRVASSLVRMLEEEKGIVALEALWAYHVSIGLDDPVIQLGLNHENPHVRRWTIRLIGDRKSASAPIGRQLADLAEKESDQEVRSQLASTAKRLPGNVALPILPRLWRHDKDLEDPHVPLLTWWALESKAESDREHVLELFADGSIWHRPMVQRVILERLMQRWAMAGSEADLLACAELLKKAPTEASKDRLLIGLEKGFTGRSAGRVPAVLREAVERAWNRGGRSSNVLLGLRLGHRPSIESARALLENNKGDLKTRLSILRTLAEIDLPECIPGLLQLVEFSRSPEVQREAISALMRYPRPEIGVVIVRLYPHSLPEQNGVRTAAHNLLASRVVWAKQFVRAIDEGKLSSRSVPLDVVQKLILLKDNGLQAQIHKHWGKVRSTPEDKKKEMLRVGELIRAKPGNASAGVGVFTNTCGKCHKLFGVGADVGPELTGYERNNAVYWLENIIDPSAAIREEYQSFVIETLDGRTLTGIISDQNKTTITIKDQEGRLTKLDRRQIDDLRASRHSIMPEDQLKGLTDQQIRDLFAYLMAKSAPK